MKKFIRKLVLKFIPRSVKQEILNSYNNGGMLSYSQEGEDVLLKRIFGNKKSGFYVDVGAHHPTRFSNTFFFYKNGWRGINIDPMPNSSELFNRLRERDINLELGVGSKKEKLDYFIFNEPALNTFSAEEAKAKDGLNSYVIVDRIKVEVYPLSAILEKYLPEDTEIDFMSIDVEGLDIEVVQSNNWNIYRPKILLVEELGRFPLVEISSKSEIYSFLRKCEYRLIAKTYNTLFFEDERLQ